MIDDRDRIPSVVRAVAAAAAAGDGLAHAVFPVPEGRWVILHASPLGGRDAGVGIIIEGAQPVTLSEVIAGAYGLTPRERDGRIYPRPVRLVPRRLPGRGRLSARAVTTRTAMS